MNYKKFVGATSAALMIVISSDSGLDARRLGTEHVQNAA